MHADRRVQARSRLPRPEAHASDVLALHAGRVERHPPPRTGEDVTSIDESRNLCLDAFKRTVDVSDSTTGSPFLTQDVPRFQGCPEFDLHTALDEFPDVREPELEVRVNHPLSSG